MLYLLSDNIHSICVHNQYKLCPIITLVFSLSLVLKLDTENYEYKVIK
jgi:hypothetical protein